MNTNIITEPCKKINEIDKRTEKKHQNIAFRKLLNPIVDDINMTCKTFTRIDECATFLEYISDADHEKLKMTNANFCKHRFCPNCSYTKARRLALELSCMVEHAKNNDLSLLFLTLTVPNVPSFQLEKTLREMSKSFDRLMKRREIKKIIRGFIRKLEITYNEKRNDYHPHYHVIIAVNKSYFTNSKMYIKQKKWLEYWRESARDDSITQVDIRKFNTEVGHDKAIFEMSKYIAKDSNYLHSEEVFKTFYDALKKKREMNYGGFFKTARTQYLNGELDKYKTLDTTKYIYKMYFHWRQNEYKCIDMLMLTPAEIEKYNIVFDEDMEVE